MSKRDDLLDLVQSLSRSEKRYFRVNANTQQGDKRYLRLFDALLKQKEYDGAALQRALGKDMTDNQFNFLKNYLYNAILSSLSQLYSKSESGQLRSQLQKIKILYDKGLYDQSRKVLRKAKKRAGELEDYVAQEEVLLLQKELLAKEQDQHGFPAKSEQLLQEEQAMLIRMEQLAESDYLFSNVRFLYHAYGHPRSEEELADYQQLFEHDLFRSLEERQELPHKVKINLLLSRIIYHMCLYDHRQHHHYARQLLNLYQENKNRIVQNPASYLNALSYYLKSCALLGDRAAFEQAIAAVKNLEDTLPAGRRSRSLAANIFFIASYNELFFYLQNCLIDECISLLEDIEAGLQIFQDQLTNSEKIYLTYSIALVYFARARFQDSLEWFNHILNTFKQEAIPHIRLRIRLMLLINHFELNHTRLLESLVISTYRYLLRKQKMYQYESAVIRFIRKLPTVSSTAELDALFESLLSELLDIIKDPFEFAGCAWFVYWLEGKEAGIGLREVFRNKALSNSLD